MLPLRARDLSPLIRSSDAVLGIGQDMRFSLSHDPTPQTVTSELVSARFTVPAPVSSQSGCPVLDAPPVGFFTENLHSS